MRTRNRGAAGSRVAQGVFAGLMVPQVLAFIRVAFPADEQGRARGFYGMTFPIGGLAGPLLGGLLTQAGLFGWGWRTVFLVNVPIAVVVALAAALLAALYPLVQGRELGWPLWTAGAMVAGIALLGVFALQLLPVCLLLPAGTRLSRTSSATAGPARPGSGAGS
ncbi:MULTISPECIES: MFS transporter [Amycolatopsis]|uniref:MFS transporter n=2 Tax=Pseudonocardiaceae TaxID=2070 RepID=UPI001304532A|nr:MULTISPECIES: MFS transporter [Amycolatopsis]